jgi:hypothetical protein
MSDKLSFLGGTDPVEPLDAPVVEPTPEPAAEAPQDGPIRDEGGRFASPATPEPEPTPEPVVEPVLEPVAPPAPEPGHVPVSALQTEREKRQAAERERDELRKQAAPARPAPQPQPIPDRWEDPEAYEAYQTEQLHAAILNNKLDLSEDMARSKHSDELVDAAKAWAIARFENSPAYYQEVIGSRNPYEKAVQDYRRDQVASQVQLDDLDEYLAWKATKANPAPQPAPLAPAPAPAPHTAPKPPPRSIAAAPSAGGPAHVPSGPGAAFDAVFSSKG